MFKSLRRWKTICKQRKREKELVRTWGNENLHPKFLEHPTCDCQMCNKKNGWNEKPKKRKTKET